MRKGIHSGENAKYKIIAVDDESGILDTLGVFLEKKVILLLVLQILLKQLKEWKLNILI